MKTQFLYFFGFVLAALLFTSCSKENEITEPGGFEYGDMHFSCELDGIDYRCLEVYSYGIDDTNSNATLVYGVQENGESIYIQVPNNLSVGEHDFNDQLFAFVSVNDKTFATHFVDQQFGMIDIESRTTEAIKGTFTFVVWNVDDAAEGMEIEKGSFNVNIRK